MAGGWVRSLQCKSRAFDDVFHPNPRTVLSNTSCRKTSQSIKDVIQTATRKPNKPNPKPLPRKPEPAYIPPPRCRNSDSFLPALTELPVGHPSRNVVEIIFHTSWGPKAFMGQIEMIFKVQKGSRTAARFEEYREAVRARAGSGSDGGLADEENARCVADGNEVMRFHCLGATSGNSGVTGGAWSLSGGKGVAICTHAGSGSAHESAGGGRGRKAMLVCRVIAGRVSKRAAVGPESLDGSVGFDSVSGENGELLVYDHRAVLPCFLIIYKL